MNEYAGYYVPAGTTNINYTTNASRQYPTYKVTRTIAQPIVVSREDLIRNLAGATDQYKKALADYNDLGTAVGASVDKDMITKALSAPQNKGRLESEMSWAQALSGGLLQGFKSYNDAAAQKMNMYKNQYDAMLNEAKMVDELKAREEAAAAKNAELNKKTIEETKYTDPVGGGYGNIGIFKGKNGETQVVSPLTQFRSDLEDIGTRFDSSFKNIDEMQKGSTRWGRWNYNNLWGLGTSTPEKQARDDFEAWKGSMRNVLVNANRQAGSGSMSDADAQRFEQDIGNARTPAEARNILDSFEAKLLSTPVKDLREAYGKQELNYTPVDVAKLYGATIVNQ